MQPWAVKGDNSTAMGRHRGHSTAMGRQRRSQYSYGQTKGVAVQPWADTRAQRTAMCLGLYSRTNFTAEGVPANTMLDSKLFNFRRKL